VFVSNECLNWFSYKAAIGDKSCDTRRLRANWNSYVYESSLWRRWKMSASGSSMPEAVVQVRWVSWMSTDQDNPYLWLMTRINAEWMPWSRKIAELSRDIALKLGISQERVYHIIEMLNYRKVCARWVPRQLTNPMKEHRKTVAKEVLNRYRLEGDDFLKNIAVVSLV
jgi:hypothetical protein